MAGTHDVSAGLGVEDPVHILHGAAPLLYTGDEVLRGLSIRPLQVVEGLFAEDPVHLLHHVEELLPLSGGSQLAEGNLLEVHLPAPEELPPQGVTVPVRGVPQHVGGLHPGATH